MAYITQEYYDNTYLGESVLTSDFPSLLSRAEEIVEEMCMYRISEEKLAAYCESTQERIKKAICAQIEYLDANGGNDLDHGSDIQSATLGKFSYTKQMTGSGTSIYAPRALRYLAPTRLLYRGGCFY